VYHASDFCRFCVDAACMTSLPERTFACAAAAFAWEERRARATPLAAPLAGKPALPAGFVVADT
jgi:hypothetical protein